MSCIVYNLAKGHIEYSLWGFAPARISGVCLWGSLTGFYNIDE